MTSILALDIGTSSARALLFNDAMKRAAIAQAAYAHRTTADGGMEVDADQLLQLTARVIDEVLADAQTSIAAVATANFWHSLLAVGPDDLPRSPVYSWADNRAGAWVPALRALENETETHARTGCVFHPSYWPAKLLWLRDARPDLFGGATRWMSWAEYLALKWTGQARASLCMASGTGIFNQNRNDWDDDTLSHLPIRREQLSPLCDFSDALPPLRAELRERWPQLRDAVWFPALGDGACSNIGSGASQNGVVALNAGTSGALRVVARDLQTPAPRGLWRYRVDAKRALLGGAISNVGSVLKWARANLQLPDDYAAQVAQLAPDSHGLTVLPFLAGERSPLWNPDAKFVVSGATLDTTPVEVLRACLEAVALRFAAVYERMSEAVYARELIVSGGAFEALPGWSQIACDALGVAMRHSVEPEATARGAALLAREALGLPLVNRQEHGATLQPDMAAHERYRRALERQNALYEQLYETA